MEGSPRIFARVEKRLEHLVQHEGGQANAIGRKGHRGCRAVIGAEGAALVKDGGQRQGDDDQRHGGGQGQDQREFRAAVEGFAPALGIARPQAAGQVGQKDGAHGDCDHAERKLVQAVGIDEP